MKIIFRKDLFLKDAIKIKQDKELIEVALNSWVSKCDGREVELNIGDYIIHEDWCEIVEE